jgi:hypothetical protein
MTDTSLTIIPESGAATYRLSTDAAGLSRAIVMQTAVSIQGRQYVKVEGWQAIAVAHGCTASSGSVERTEDGFRAVGQVRRMDTGAVIAEAEGFVGIDEPVWFGGEATDRWGKKKTHLKRPDYAIRAMAQTRAISRACRSAFAHVVVMIDKNLSTTPAEEMMGLPENQRQEPDSIVEEAKAVYQQQSDERRANGQLPIRKAKPSRREWVDYAKDDIKNFDAEAIHNWLDENAAKIDQLEEQNHSLFTELMQAKDDRLESLRAPV